MIYFCWWFTKSVFYSKSFPELYGGRRKLPICFHPCIPSEEDGKWRRAQHHRCRAAAGLHDHSMAMSPSQPLPLFTSFSVLTFQFFKFIFLLPSCGQNCHHRRSSSLPPSFMNTVTVLLSMSSALTCDNSTGTAESFFYLVWTTQLFRS